MKWCFPAFLIASSCLTLFAAPETDSGNINITPSGLKVTYTTNGPAGFFKNKAGIGLNVRILLPDNAELPEKGHPPEVTGRDSTGKILEPFLFDSGSTASSRGTSTLLEKQLFCSTLPAPGAEWVEIEGTVPIRELSNPQESKPCPLELSPGKKIKPEEGHLVEVNKRARLGKEQLDFLVTGHVKDLILLDDQGNRLPVKQGNRISRNPDMQPVYHFYCPIDYAGKHVNASVVYYQNPQIVNIPLHVKAHLGGNPMAGNEEYREIPGVEVKTQSVEVIPIDKDGPSVKCRVTLEITAPDGCLLIRRQEGDTLIGKDSTGKRWDPLRFSGTTYWKEWKPPSNRLICKGNWNSNPGEGAKGVEINGALHMAMISGVTITEPHAMNLSPGERWEAGSNCSVEITKIDKQDNRQLVTMRITAPAGIYQLNSPIFTDSKGGKIELSNGGTWSTHGGSLVLNPELELPGDQTTINVQLSINNDIKKIVVPVHLKADRIEHKQ